MSTAIDDVVDSDTEIVVAPEKPSATPEPEAELADEVKHQPPYAVILHDDPVNGFEYVVRTLIKVFKYSLDKAYVLTLTAHEEGRSCVWTSHRELAELKAEQIQSCGPDPMMKAYGAGKLRVTIEPLPQ